jgi:hypothetical protein
MYNQLQAHDQEEARALRSSFPEEAISDNLNIFPKPVIWASSISTTSTSFI